MVIMAILICRVKSDNIKVRLNTFIQNLIFKITKFKLTVNGKILYYYQYASPEILCNKEFGELDGGRDFIYGFTCRVCFSKNVYEGIMQIMKNLQSS